MKTVDVRMGLGKYKVVYHAERPLCMWNVVGCVSGMRGAQLIFLKLGTNDKSSLHICCVDKMTPFSVMWDRNDMFVFQC
jgi:hypothetical protein